MNTDFEELKIIWDDSPSRLDKCITSRANGMSRSKIQKLIETKLVKVNGQTIADRSFQVKAGDEILINFKHSIPSHLLAKEIPFAVLYEDEDLMVIDKPAGLTVHPGAGNHTDTLVNALLYYTKGKLAGDSSRPGIVHRLDKDTSGVMLIAKSEAAHAGLSKAIADREVSRTYIALVYGKLVPAIGTINTAYGRSKVDRKKMTVKHHGDKYAVTHYKVLRVFRDTISEVECKLETGRTHQIRVHMDHRKAPIVGDQTYGRSKNHNLSAFTKAEIEQIKSFPRQALHARKIGFSHPVSGVYLEFESQIPDDIERVLKMLQCK